MPYVYHQYTNNGDVLYIYRRGDREDWAAGLPEQHQGGSPLHRRPARPAG